MQVTGATDGWLGMGFSEGSSVSMIGGSGGGSDTFICSELEVKRYWYLGWCFSPCFSMFFLWMVFFFMANLVSTKHLGSPPTRFHRGECLGNDTMSVVFWLKDYDIST